tara:strand:+ start:244 stop:495 length:252 start_codon:yes stop_codon:yes gene_type:complete
MNNEEFTSEKQIELTFELEKAIEMVEQARDIVDAVMSDLPGLNLERGIASNYEAYGKYGFNELLGDGNPYDNSLHTLIDKINN